ncbi:hypothetical protein RJ55_04792 [Drechmeria coniospora]|nr:hypothetical protein RJ55_04792 [Drechmeria coniospora]
MITTHVPPNLAPFPLSVLASDGILKVLSRGGHSSGSVRLRHTMMSHSTLLHLLLAIVGLACLVGVQAVPTPPRGPVRQRVKRDAVPESDEAIVRPKYFTERIGDPHYDARFFVRRLDDDDQLRVIRSLIQTYLDTFHQLGIDTWLMHGSLLGWWWGKKVASALPAVAPLDEADELT